MQSFFFSNERNKVFDVPHITGQLLALVLQKEIFAIHVKSVYACNIGWERTTIDKQLCLLFLLAQFSTAIRMTKHFYAASTRVVKRLVCASNDAKYLIISSNFHYKQ